MSNRIPHVLGIVIVFILTAKTLLAQSSDYVFSGNYTSHSVNNNILEVLFEGGILNVRYFDGIGFHIQYAKSGINDEGFNHMEMPDLRGPQIQETAENLRIAVAEEILTLQKKPLRLRFEHQNGHIYLKESLGAGWYQNKPIHVFEKDDKTFLYATDHENNIGQAALGLSTNHTWGIFYHNSSKNRVEIGSPSVKHWGFSADGDGLRFTFVTGVKPADIFKKVRLYSGASVMPPIWALGFHTVLDNDATSEDVINYSSSLKKNILPVDVVRFNPSIQSDYVPFTWDGSKVPDAKDLTHQLASKGVRIVIPLSSRFPNHTQFEFIGEGLRQGVFLNGENYDSTRSYSYLPTTLLLDQNHPGSYLWWKAQIEKKLSENVAGFSFVKESSHPKNANILDRIYGLISSNDDNANDRPNGLQSMTNRALRELQPKQRSTVYSSSSNLESNKDIHYVDLESIVDGESLGKSITRMIDLGILGYPGSMIGIGADLSNDKYIYQEALALSALVPGVSMYANVARTMSDLTEPNKEHLVLLRQYAALRYHFTPMMYTAWWQHTQEASPIVRPSWWYGLEASAHITDHVYIGDHLWYAPRLKMSQINFQKDLPKGIWYHYFTKRQVLSNTLTQLPNLIPTANQTAYQSMALFVRAGSVIPTREISDYLNSKEPKELSLNVFAGASATSYLYEDDGSYITDGKTSRVLQFKTENHSRGFRITASQIGELTSAIPRFSYLIHGLPKKPDRITVNGRNIVYFYEPTTNTIIFKISAGVTDIQIFFP